MMDLPSKSPSLSRSWNRMYCTDEAQGTRQKCSVSKSSAEHCCWFSRDGEAEREQRFKTERERQSSVILVCQYPRCTEEDQKDSVT